MHTLASSILSLTLVCMLGGCASTQPNLHISSEKAGGDFVHAFPIGVADVQDAGAIDAVLTCHTNGGAANCPSVTQTMHIRVLWAQGHTIRAEDKLASQNAAFRWYVTPAGESGDLAGRIEYRGTGLVQMKTNGDQIVMKIENARLTPVAVTGKLHDGLGSTTLNGTVTVRRDRDATAVALGDLRATLAGARTGSEAEARLSVEP